ncbi:unnamed protein product [Amaranthus hypochondriacus]
MAFSERSKRDGEWSVVLRRRNVTNKIQTSPHRFNFFRATSRVSDGHRGFSRHQWWRGPREPPLSRAANPITLFVEGISRTTSMAELRRIFEYEGQVLDVYISGKRRKNKEGSFGFIRYGDSETATRAVDMMNGVWLQGSRLKVSMAKYQKGGIPIKESNPTLRHPAQVNPAKPKTKTQPLVNYKNRDHRRYADVLMGKNKQQVEMGKNVEDGEKEGSMGKTHLKIQGNSTMTDRMERAAVVEVKKAEDMESTVARLNDMDIPLAGISALTSTKIALFFDDDSDLLGAMENSSPLRSLFPEVRKWSEKENYLVREVWIECRALDPRCWSHENLLKIGRLWGDVLRVDHGCNGLNSITSARMLISTAYPNKIEKKVNIEWELGTFTVWVNECHVCNCMEIMENVSESDCQEDQERQSLMDGSKGAAVEQLVGVRITPTGVLTENRPLIDTTDQQVCQQEAAVLKARMSDKRLMGTENTLEQCRQIVLNAQGDGIESTMMGRQVLDQIFVGDTLNEGLNGVEEGELGTHDNISIPQNSPYINHQMGTVEIENNDEENLFFDGLHIFNEENNCETAPTHVVEVPEHTKLRPLEVLMIRQDECNETVNSLSRLDPMLTIESSIGTGQLLVNNNSNNLGKRIMSSMEHRAKKPRGRPKRVACSLPVPLFVPSTPSNSDFEAQKTWDTAKALGITARNEKAVLSHLRKSKRLLAMEESNPLLEESNPLLG